MVNDVTINIQKQIDYWNKGAHEDRDVGFDLVSRGKARHGLFFVHLALEKAFKAHACKATGKFAPRIHSLLRLAETSRLELSEEQLDFMARFDQYNIAGRYPGSLEPLPSRHETERDMRMAHEVLEWLTSML